MPLHHIDTASDVSITWTIAAPPTRVWQCLTDPALLREWLGTLAEGAVAPDSGFVVDHGDGYLCRSTVRSCAAPRELAFTWHFPDEPPSRVSIRLEETPDCSVLRLAHEDLVDLATSYRIGWCTHLTYLEAAALGTPLPWETFWSLHGTLAALDRAG